ncbi:MAG: hypothetical protein WC378_10665, partial [Opitutaceae bacterium]
LCHFLRSQALSSEALHLNLAHFGDDSGKSVELWCKHGFADLAANHAGVYGRSWSQRLGPVLNQTSACNKILTG